ncbi:hypothetical protein V2J09_005178 [Rumex salicifolius]
MSPISKLSQTNRDGRISATGINLVRPINSKPHKLLSEKDDSFGCRQAGKFSLILSLEASNLMLSDQPAKSNS